MIVPFLLSLPLLVPASHVDGEGAEDNVLRYYDVSGLRLSESMDEDEGSVLTLGVRYDAIDDSPDRYEEDGSGSEAFVDLVLELLGSEFEYEGRSVTITQDQRLAVRGPAGLHERVGSVLRFLETTLNAQVELSVDVVTLPARMTDDLPSVITNQRAQELIAAGASGGGHQGYRLPVRADQTASLELLERTMTIVDFDVEIAQGSAIQDPISAYLSTGTSIHVRAAAGDGGTHLALVSRRGRPLPGRELDLELGFFAGIPERGGIQYVRSHRNLTVLDCLEADVAVSTFLADDSVLALRTKVGVAKGATDEVLLIRRTGGGLARRSEIELAPGGPRLILMDAGAAAPPRAWTQGAILNPRSVAPRLSSNLHDESWLVSQLRSGDIDFLLEVFQSGTQQTGLDVFGPWIVSRPYDSFGQQGASAIRAEQDALLGAFDRSVVGGELLDVTLAVHRNDGKDATPILARVPVRPGSSAAFSMGVGGPDVISYDVEVAQIAAVADPWVEQGFDGLMLWLRATPREDGHLMLEVRGGIQLELGDRMVDIGDESGSAYQELRYQNLAIGERMLLAPDPNHPGAWSTEIGNASRGSSSEGLTLAVSVLRL